MFVCGKKSMLLLTWTMKYKVITSRLDKAPKEITDSTATDAKASQASEDLASEGRQRRLQQITTAQIRAHERDTVQRLINIATYVLVYSEIKACRYLLLNLLSICVVCCVCVASESVLYYCGLYLRQMVSFQM